MDYEKKELIYNILKVLAAGTVVAAAVVAPGTLIALAPFFAKETKSDRKRVYEALRYAQRQKWVKVAEKEEGIKVKITKQGRRRWQQLHFDRPLSGNQWDGIWRIVIFDIPNKRKVVREAVRDTLKRLGFHQLQKSVWITPWQCDEHIDALRNFYLMTRHVQLIETGRIERESALLAKFNLKR